MTCDNDHDDDQADDNDDDDDNNNYDDDDIDDELDDDDDDDDHGGDDDDGDLYTSMPTHVMTASPGIVHFQAPCPPSRTRALFAAPA